MNLRIQIDDLSSAQSQALITEHLVGMHANSPPSHVNALAIEALRAPNVTFWTAWAGDEICGCGALKELGTTSGEVKSMRTRSEFLKHGVGQAILDEIQLAAKTRDYKALYLETGTGLAFEAAHALYIKNGFAWCDAFDNYVATDFNVFMVKPLLAESSAT